MELDGRVVLLTGATGGIGSATARALAQEGARLVLFARGAERLASLEREIAAGGGQGHAVAGDVRVAADAERAVAESVRRFGRLDALVNNAGVGYLAALWEATEAQVREMLEVNVLGAFCVTRAALPALAAQGKGAVVNVASYAGRVGAPYYSFYSASKFALVGMTEAWRRELKPRGIDVTLVLPAAVETSFLDRLGRDRALGRGPAGTIVPPDRVARAIAAALRRPRPEIYLPGRNRWLGILNALFPRLADRIVTGLFRYPARRAG